MSLLRLLLQPYVIPVAAVGGMAFARGSLNPILGDQAPLLFFVLAVVISAWRGGLGPGLLATALSAVVGALCFLAPIDGSPATVPLSERERLAIFLMVGASISGVSQAVRAAKQQAQVSAAALREGEEVYRAVFDRAGVGKVQVDLLTGRFLEVNRKFCQITGYSAAELQGMTFAQITHPDDRGPDLEAARQMARGEREEFTTEKRFCRKDGSVIWVHLTATVIHDPGGGPLRGAAVIQDITERMELQEALRQRAEVLVEADRQKNEFLAMLAHELRNPLAAVSNALEVVRAAGADARAREAMDVLQRQVEHQMRLVDDLLDVSRVTRNTIRLCRQRLDLVRLVRDTLSDHRPALEKAGLALAVELPSAPLWVDGDPTRLAQVLGNLLQNSAKFTDPGGRVTVRLSVEAEIETRRHGDTEKSGRERELLSAASSVSPCLRVSSPSALLSVADTGVGIEPEMLSRVFEPFVQADRSLDRNRGGLGLGLPLVKRLVELHHGRVCAESLGEGQGMTFTIRLPLQEEPARLPENPAPAPVTSRALRVLVIEDNADVSDMLCALLGNAGHEVAAAHSGPEGLTAARRFRPDVVLCDIGLPEMDGYAVAAALRGDPATATARLIAISGYGQEEDQERSREAGFDLHLIKPVRAAELKRVLSA